jgi:NitT/TauT family transport system permease protein
MRRALLVPAILMCVWLAISELHLVTPIILPHVGTVFERLYLLLFTSNNSVWPDVAVTMAKVVLAFSLSAVGGVLLGVLMGASRGLHGTLFFPVDFLRSLPATAIFPIFMLVLGIGFNSHVAYIAFPCLWINTINAMYGVLNASAVRREMAVVSHASRLQVLLYVTLPDSLPHVASGLRLSVSAALIMAIAAEMLMGSKAGLGRRIFDAHFTLQIADMYAVIIVVGMIGYALNRIVLLGERRIVHWGGKEY